MAYDSTTLEIQLTAIQAAITAALANPRPDWQVGQVRMNQSAYLKMLFDQQKALIDELKAFPAEVINTVNDRIGLFGHDMTEYHNEDNG